MSRDRDNKQLVGQIVLNLDRDVSIVNLNVCEGWLPIIANWHHGLWLKGQSGKKANPGKHLREREAALSRHLDDDALPTTYVAHREQQPIGTVSLVYYQFSRSQVPTEWLTNLYVLPAYRCQGVASLLLSAALTHAAHCKLSRLLLYTVDQEEFYRKRNWRTINKGVVQGQKVDIMDYPLN